MTKSIVKILMTLLILSILNVNNIKAYNIKEVNYYLDNVLSEDIDAFYEDGTTNYPDIKGYTFKHKITNDESVNLYYETKILNIYISGNGGFIGDDEVIKIDTIRYGETYTYLRDYVSVIEYPFKKEGYTLDGFSREANLNIVAKNDIYYYAKWKPVGLYYIFLIGNTEYRVNQNIGTNIKLPEVTENINFLSFVDENNNNIDSNYFVETNENKTFYAKFENESLDFISTTSTIKIKLNNNETYMIEIDGIYTEGITDGKYILFNNLNPNTNYNIKVISANNEIITVIKTKENLITDNFAIFVEGEKYLLLNNEFNYYYNDNLIETNLFNFTNIDLNDIFIQEVGSLDKTSLSSSDVEFLYNNEMENYEVVTNATGKIEVFFNKKESYKLFIDGNYNFGYEEMYINLEDVRINSKIILITYSNTNSMFYQDISFIRPNISFNVYNNHVEINNPTASTIKFNGDEFNEQLIIINDLNNNTLYDIDIYLSLNEYYRYYFYTTNILEFDIETLELEVLDNKIIINNYNLNYEYKLFPNKYTNSISPRINNNSITFDYLKPNTKYDLFIVDNNGKEYKIQTIDTLKMQTENINGPLINSVLSDINTNSFKILNSNKDIEYSVDNISFFSSELDYITIDNLDSYTKYYLYARYKASSFNEHSLSTIVNIVITLIEEPSIDSLFDLVYDHNSISFKKIEGYNYYYRDELIEDNDFYLTDLEKNSTHSFKILRISDGFMYEIDIKLRNIGSLNENDRNIEYLVSPNSITITNSVINYHYILKLNDKVVASNISASNNITFTELLTNTTYKLYIVKAPDSDNFYYEEYVIDIYVPKDIVKLLNSYIIQYKLKSTNKTKEIIEDYQDKVSRVKSKTEFEEMYESAIKEISNSSKLLNIIVLSSVGGVLVLTTGFIIYKTKGKKKRKKV